MTSTRISARRLWAAGTAVVSTLLIMIAMAGPASATAYRFWSYWQGASGQWVAASTGPGDYNVVDQDVQGWRFAISTESVSQAPDNTAVFAELCPDLAATTPPASDVRVAVVVDSGFVADAPKGETPPADVVYCITVPKGSTGSQALAAATSVSQQDGMVCAIAGYPADECGAEVSDADASAAASAAANENPNPADTTSQDSDESSSTNAGAFALGAAALAALIAAAFLIPARRRRNRATEDEGQV